MNETEINYLVSCYLMVKATKDFSSYNTKYKSYLKTKKFVEYIKPYTNYLDGYFKNKIYYSFSIGEDLDIYIIKLEQYLLEQFEEDNSTLKQNFLKVVKRNIIIDSL